MTSQSAPQDPITVGTQRRHALVIDTHWVVRNGLKTLLEENKKFFVKTAGSFDEMVERTSKQSRFDIFILDTNIPEHSPREIFTHLCRSHPRTPVLVFSDRRRRADALAAFNLGAVGYIPKTADAKVITSCVNRIIAGEVVLPKELLVIDDPVKTSALLDDHDLSQVFSAFEAFTPRQKQIFELLATGARNKEIAEKLGLSVNTVRVHLQAISSRLPSKDRSQIVLYASRWRERAARSH